MKIEFKDYLEKISVAKVISLAKFNYLDNNFDDNNIMVAMEGIEKHFDIFHKEKLTMLTIKKVLPTYQDLINELDLYETKYESIPGSLHNKALFFEQPIILHDKTKELTLERFIVLGGKNGGGKGSSAEMYNCNNNAKIKTFIASESFLKDKLSIVNFNKIIEDCSKKELFFNNNGDLIPVRLEKIHTRSQFKMCAELKNLNDNCSIYLSSLDNELVFEEKAKDTKISISNHVAKKRVINVSKYLQNI